MKRKIIMSLILLPMLSTMTFAATQSDGPQPPAPQPPGEPPVPPTPPRAPATQKTSTTSSSSKLTTDEINQKMIIKNASEMANSNAMAGVPQLGANHLFGVGVGTSYINGVGGFAVGFSGTIPNQAFIYKLVGSVSTKKDFGFTAGATYSFGEINKTEKANPTKITSKDINTVPVQLEIINSKGVKTTPFVFNENELMKLKELSKLSDEKIEQLQSQSVDGKSGMLQPTVSTNINKIILDGYRNNSFELTKGQYQFIKSNLDLFKKAKYIELTGFASLSGNYRYDMILGLKRAVKLKETLVKLGIEKDKITVKSSGNSTIISMKSAHNRRVEINLK